MLSNEVDAITPMNRYGLLVESEAILPDLYKAVTSVMWKFRAVFTHSDTLLRNNSNAKWIPGSGTWIGGDFAGGEPSIYPKTKTCSMISSRKWSAPLHRKRLAIAYLLRNSTRDVDVFIPRWRSRNLISILDTLIDYRYSIVIENFIGRGYFTEKILNCFATGTVPIYLGSPNISQYFDARGIIQIGGLRDLLQIALPMMSVRDYDRRLGAIESNFRTCGEYGAIEDYIVQTYPGLFENL